MFQTEPIKLLQSLATDGLTELMVLVSGLGYSEFYIPVLILITFGVSFRKGFLLTQMMLWVGIVTDLLKNVIALPRPADVDSAVKLLAETDVTNPTPFTGKGGVGFWDLPDREAIRIIRLQPDWSYGLPSGHVSGTTAFWGGLSLVFRGTPIRVAAVVMIGLMPLSRMYLGRHFLADVLAGFLLGLVFLGLIHTVFVRPGTAGRLVELSRLHLSAGLPTLIVLSITLLPPLLLLALSPLVEPEAAGHLFGLNVAFLLLALGGLPQDAGSWPRRVGRVLLAFAIYLVTVWLVGQGLDLASAMHDHPWIEFPATAIPTFAALWGGVKVSLGLGLYR